MVEESFVNDLPDDSLEALQEVIHRINNHYSSRKGSQSELLNALKSYLEAFAYAEVSIGKNNLGWPIPALTSTNLEQAGRIGTFFSGLCSSIDAEISSRTVERHKEKFSHLLGNGFVYEFSDEDFDRIQELINVLRDEIKNCELLKEEHRERLLNRLERLQNEFHKKMANLDIFFGIIIEGSVVLGKAGENIKPLTDRFCEIGEIVFKIFRKSKGIPTDISLPPLKLGEGSENEDENL